LHGNGCCAVELSIYLTLFRRYWENKNLEYQQFVNILDSTDDFKNETDDRKIRILEVVYLLSVLVWSNTTPEMIHARRKEKYFGEGRNSG
jgi:hypothetical protein